MQLPEHTTDPDRSWWRTPRALEAGTALVLALLALAYARPLLEEWGLNLRWKASSWDFWNQAKVHVLRPLESAPSWVDWLLGGGATIGLALGFALLLVAKYGAARWAVTPVLGPEARWVAATLAAVLVAWPGEWRMRFSPAQLSTVFLLIALGAVIRSRDRFAWRWLIAGALGTALMLATYQALILCAVVLPLVALLATPAVIAASRRDLGFVLLRTGTPVVAGFAIYAIYAVIAKSTVHQEAYEETLFASGAALRTISGIRAAFSDVYRTAYLNSTLTFALLAGFAALLAGPGLIGVADRRRLGLRLGALALAVLGLPLLAAAYVFTPAQRVDPDRILFPVAVGFVLLAIVVLARFRSTPQTQLGWVGAGAITAVLLVSTAFDAIVRHRDYTTQNAVISAVIRLSDEKAAHSVVVRDYTGTLGDVYRLYPPTLMQALAVRGSTVEAVLCLPADVNPIHPDARRLNVDVVPRCDAEPPPKSLVLDVNRAGNDLAITAAK